MCARSVPLDIRRPSRVLTPTIVVHRLHLYSGLERPPTAALGPGRCWPASRDNARATRAAANRHQQTQTTS